MIKRPDLDLTKEDLGTFRLEDDLALGQARLGADVDDIAVDDVGDRVAVANDLHAIPFAGRLFDVAAAAKAEHVFPGRVASPPVKSTGVASDGLAPLLEVELPVGADARLAGEARFLPAVDHDEVAAAPFDQLAFLRLHPHAPGRAVGPDAMKQDSRVAGGLFPRSERPLAPLPFDDQVIVVKLVLRRQSAEFLARDLDHPVVNRENPGGIVVLMLVQVGVKSSQVLAVKLEDRLPRFEFGAVPGRMRGFPGPGRQPPGPRQPGQGRQ